jgi:hypothetical protein
MIKCSICSENKNESNYVLHVVTKKPFKRCKKCFAKLVNDGKCTICLHFKDIKLCEECQEIAGDYRN